MPSPPFMRECSASVAFQEAPDSPREQILEPPASAREQPGNVQSTDLAAVISRFDQFVSEHRKLLCALREENTILRKQHVQFKPAASKESLVSSEHEAQDENESPTHELKRDKSTSALSQCSEVSRMCRHFVLSNSWFQELTSVLDKRPSFSRSSALGAAIERGTFDEEILESEKGVCSEFILHPGSMRRLYWDLTSMVLLAWDTLTIPFVLAFEPKESPAMHIITWVTMLFWTLDIPMSFLTGFQKGKLIVLKPWSIAKNYLMFRFWLDCLIVGVDWVVVFLSVDGGNAVRLGRSLRILKLLKTLKLLRTLKLKKYIQAVQDQITSEAVSIWFGIIQVVFILLFVNHLVACLWYAIGSIDCDDCEKQGWVTAKRVGDYSVVHRYVISLHWSLAQFTPAPNEVFPQNAYERAFATAVLVTALVCFSAFVSTVTAGVVQLRNMSSAESRQFWQLRRYLKDWEVPHKFRKRVVRYLEFAFHRQRRRVQPKDVVLLDLLSDQLRVELRQQTLKSHLCWHALFSKLNQQARIFSQALGTTFLATGDLVFACAEQAQEMVFVGSGHLEYVLGELDNDLENLTDPNSILPPTPGDDIDVTASESLDRCKEAVLIGQWVCEAVLWISQWVHLGDLQAHSETQVISIQSTTFGNSVRNNRLLWMGMRKYAQRFLRALNELSREELTDMLQNVFSPQQLLYREDFYMPMRLKSDVIADASGCAVCSTLWSSIWSRANPGKSGNQGLAS